MGGKRPPCEVDVAGSRHLAREQSFTCFIWWCKHRPVARIWFSLRRDGRRHTCDTKATILLKSLMASEPTKMGFFPPPCAEKMLALSLEATTALAETSQSETGTQTRTSGGMSFIGNDNPPSVCSIWKQSPS